MDTRETRLENFRGLLKEEGGRQVKLAARLKKSPSQINQWLGGVRTINEDSARDIERLAGKPAGWLDLPHTAEDRGVYIVQPSTQTPTLEQALEVLGIAIAAVPEEHRQELADDMRQWAMYGGREKHREAVAESLARRHPDAATGKQTGT